MRVRHLLFFTLLVAFAASGCIFSPDNDEDTPPPPPNECVTAKSENEAMAAFREVYAARNLECYRKLLSPDYVFVDQNGGFDNYDEEINITRKMFEGLEGDNQIIISDITVDRLDPQGVWTATPENHPYFGGTDSMYRPYEVEINFHVSGQNLILQVRGPVLYYVENVGDADSPNFKILGMEDLTYGN